MPSESVVARLQRRQAQTQAKLYEQTRAAWRRYWEHVVATASDSEPGVAAVEKALAEVGLDARRFGENVDAMRKLLALRASVDVPARERAVAELSAAHAALVVEQAEAARVFAARVEDARIAAATARDALVDAQRDHEIAEALAGQFRLGGCDASVTPAVAEPTPTPKPEPILVVAEENSVFGLTRFREGKPQQWFGGQPLPAGLVPAAQWVPWERRQYRVRTTIPGTVLGGIVHPAGFETVVTGRPPRALVEVVERLPDLPAGTAKRDPELLLEVL